MRYIYLLLLPLFILSCSETKKQAAKRERKHQDSLSISKDKSFEDALLQSADYIRMIMENRYPSQRYFVLDNELYSSVLLPRFYLDNEFTPAWIPFWDSLERVHQMMEIIKDAEFHGLYPEHYHFDIISQQLEIMKMDSTAIFNGFFLANLDMLLTDAYFMLASHLYHGKVDTESLKAQWGIQRNKPGLVLDRKLKRFLDYDSLWQGLKYYYPAHHGYSTMVAKAREIKAMKDVDFQVEMDTKVLSIKPGDTSLFMPGIKVKLAFLGLLDLNPTKDLRPYDEKAVEAVKKLQAQFGYNTDGVIGKNTFISLNLSIDQRLKQLYVNMERLRWMPDSLEDRYIMVNIADFTLSMLQKGDTLIKMRTVVGKDYRQTPVFNALMTYLVFSPTWTIPPGIMQNDVIPAVKKSTNYLTGKNMQVLDTKGQQVDPNTIDWGKDGMRYTVRQSSGTQNALGKVKFMFPNKHSVYLHDTPSRELFARDERVFSSGCIRIEKPYELTRLLLSDMPDWTEDRIRQAMNANAERTVILKSPVGVYLYYLTAWGSDISMEINYRKDVYGRDDELMESLKTKKTGM